MVKQCRTCGNWRGDKGMAAKMIAAYPESMDLYEGWPVTGNCQIYYRWLTLTIDGNATADVEVPANFGCPYWVAEVE